MSAWEDHEREQLLRFAAASAKDRLSWLEQAKQFAASCGGLAQKHAGQVVSKSDVGRYLWGEGCEGWRLLEMPMLSVVLERMPPGTAEVRHRHARARQFFFVLEGKLAIEVEGKVQELAARDGLEIAPSLAHEVRNEGSCDAEFIVICSPSSHDDRIPAPRA